MSISTCFENIKAALDLALKAAGDELASHELGADHLSDAQSAPAITWVPKGATKIVPISGPRAPVVRRLVRPNVTPGVGEAIDTGRIGEPNQYADRFEQIEAHIWGKTFQATERLLNQFVAVMRVQATGFAFSPVSTDWTLGQEQKSKGYNVCVFTFTLRVPFTFGTQRTAEYPIGLEITPEILDAEAS